MSCEWTSCLGYALTIPMMRLPDEVVERFVGAMA